MFRLFSMDQEGRLYQLGSQGWVRKDGTTATSVWKIRDFLALKGTPPLPDGQFMVDTYIAQVDAAGLIMKTFPLTPENAESEG